MLNPRAIRNLRESLRLSQEDFGIHFGVSRATVARWESGERKPESTFEQKFEELRSKDIWPGKEFIYDAVAPLAAQAGSAPIARLKREHDVSDRALHHVAETLIDASGSHPERYVEISECMMEARELLEWFSETGKSIRESDAIRQRVDKLLLDSHHFQSLGLK